MNKSRLLRLAKLLESAGLRKEASGIYRNLGDFGGEDVSDFGFGFDLKDEETEEVDLLSQIKNEIKNKVNELRTPIAKKYYLQNFTIPRRLTKDEKEEVIQLLESLLKDLDQETRWNRAKDHK